MELKIDIPSIIEFKLEGGPNIKPEAFKAREIATIILSLEESLKAIAIKENPELDPEQLFISLVHVKRESNGLGFFPSVKQLGGAFLILASCVQDQSYERLPLRAIEGLKDLQKIIIQKPNCVGSFVSGQERISQIKPSTKIEVPDYGHVTGETVLYGVIQRVGGVVPKIFLRQHNGESLSIDVTEEIARKVGSRLYTAVGLTGLATWSPNDNKILSFKVSGILDYEEVPNIQAFSELRNRVGKYWDEIENIEQMLSLE
ncbi:hypothetical protein KK083_15305 [Fulvivirgaceae bacterium PWU4]|uniref:Uncharacterized protein n=1 Tax=Chryseosolibacter histidini TaxID=2782349 RepID=A0AAP2GJQ1_9BACT|nr:hypothetical protein [Chryseosolibacter histidini]MBT1698259.1 hypothetical protein [Chryseosolibacter histidini]